MASKKGSYETKIKISGELSPSFNNSLSRAEKEMKGLYYQARRQNAGMMTGVDGLNKFSDATFSMIAKAAKATAVGTTAILAGATIAGSSYEKQMSVVKSISGATEAEMRKLDKVAQEMGRTSEFSATESGKGLEYMAMAGWKADQMVSGLPGIMDLASASGEELGLVSDIVTDSMTALGLAADKSGRFADVLAQASASSNTNVAMMGETFRYVAPIAGSFKYAMEDVAIATGLMANSGIKGEKAGTAMRTMLTNLAKPTKQMQGYMKALEISLTDSSGEMKPLRQQMQEMREQFAELTEVQKAEYAAGIAGKEGMTGLLAIVNASEADFSRLTREIDNSAGAAKRMSNVRIDNLAGDFVLLKSAAEGAGIGIYNSMKDIMRESVQGASGIVNDFTESDFLQTLSDGMPTVRREVVQFGKAFGEAAAPIIDTGKWFLKHPDVISGSITGIGSALLTFKAAKGATNIVKMLGTLSATVGAWPVAAAGLAVGGLIGIGTAIKTAEGQMVRANLAEHFGDINLSILELKEAAKHIVGEDLFGGLDEFYKASSLVDDFENGLNQSLQEIRKSNWKLSLGIELNAEDTESYISEVNSFIKSAQDYILNSGYELKIAVGIVMGDSEEGAELLSSSDAFYGSLYSELQPLQEALQQNLNEIAENGLTLPKQEIVDGLLSDISEITSMVTDAQNAAKLQMGKDAFAGAALNDETFQNLQQYINEYTKDALTGVDDSHETILTSLFAQKAAGVERGGISQEEFDSSSAAELERYYASQAEVIRNGYQMMEDTIMSTYGDEIGPAIDSINRTIQEELPRIMEQNTTPEMMVESLNKLVSDAVNESGISTGAQMGLKKLLEGMVPAEQDLETLKQQMDSLGLQVPEIVNQSLSNMNIMSAVSGDTDSIWTLIGSTIANDEDYAVLTASVEQQTGQIPDAAMSAITAKNGEVVDTARSLLKLMEETFAEGVTATIPVTINTVADYRGGRLDLPGRKPENHAYGGLMEHPTLSYFAERVPEMAIPIDGSSRSIGLWEETGKLLGAYEQNNYGKTYSKMTDSGAAVQKGTGDSKSFAPVYAPVMNFYGNTSREDIEAAGMTKYEQFCEWIEQYQNEKSRVAFAR